MVRTYLETGKRWVFACAIDHPGWQRRGKTADDALDLLESYRRRYGRAVGAEPVGDLEVVGTVAGTATTEFGAPDAIGSWDEEPVGPGEVTALEHSWGALDRAVASASAELRKGPRGGGRDRDAIADHVREAERSYARKLGLRLAPRVPWAEQRAAISTMLRGDITEARDWPLKYFVRRTAWHVLDHTWEIEDKSMS